MYKPDLSKVPTKPGCYFWLDDNDQIIYIGKAKNLKSRMNSYYSKSVNGKTQILLRNISSFSYIVTNSEREALVLENNLIRKHSPKFNIKIKDSSMYPYVVLEKSDSPRLFVKYGLISESGSTSKYKYFGPFPDGTSIRGIVNILNEYYPFRKCKKNEKNCLYEEMGKCIGEADTREKIDQYKLITNEVKDIFNGNYSKLKKVMTSVMKDAAKNENFEEAISIKEIISNASFLSENESATITGDKSSYDSIGWFFENGYLSIHIDFIRNGELVAFDNYITICYEEPLVALSSYINMFYQKHPLPKNIIIDNTNLISLIGDIGSKLVVPERGNKLNISQNSMENASLYHQREIDIKVLKDDSKNKSINTLKGILQLPDLNWIEAFDNAEFHGESRVSAMVTVKDGDFFKEGYRKYNLEENQFNDDYKAMREVIYRRYFYLLKDGLPLPSLVIVDGGIGQYNIASDVLKSLNLKTLPLISLVKDGNHKTNKIIFNGEVLEIPEDSYQFLYGIQEETHRFVNSFHRNKITKNMFSSSLEKIPGITDAQASKLIEKYKKVSIIKQLTIEQLSAVIPLNKAKLIFDYYNDQNQTN